MKISLLVIGKTTDGRLVSLIDDYRQRLSHYVPFELVVLPDIKNAKSLTQDQLKAAEGEAILAKVGTTEVVLLDEHGAEYRSVDFASWLQKKMGSGRDLTLVIGGAYALVLLLARRVKRRDALPLAPFLLAGLIWALFFGPSFAARLGLNVSL